MKPTIDYKSSFVLFWGLALGGGLFAGGLLMLALTCMMILCLITHEHAHAVECINRGVQVKRIWFTWLGGAIDADLKEDCDAIPILLAGVKDTACYTFAFGGVFAVLLNLYTPAMPFQFIAMAKSMLLFAGVLTLTNVLPLTFHSKEHGEISTDGWAAFKLWRKNKD
jgi:hypothetical protein